MATKRINEISKLLGPYANHSHLECDGLSRVFHRVLWDEGIAHTVFVGVVTHYLSQHSTPIHFWIDLSSGLRIDYRLQRWLGAFPDIPHGIFDPKDFSAVHYEGDVADIPIFPKFLIDELLTPYPLILPEG